LVVWIEREAVGLAYRCVADDLVGGEPAKPLEAAGEIVDGDDVVEVPPELVVAVVVGSLDGRVLDGSVPARNPRSCSSPSPESSSPSSMPC
jgi:hypothetical protein